MFGTARDISHFILLLKYIYIYINTFILLKSLCIRFETLISYSNHVLLLNVDGKIELSFRKLKSLRFAQYLS